MRLGPVPIWTMAFPSSLLRACGTESQCSPITVPCFSQFLLDGFSYFLECATFDYSLAGAVYDYEDYHQPLNFSIPNVHAVLSKLVSNTNDTTGILVLNQNPFPAIFIPSLRSAVDDEVFKYQCDLLVHAWHGYTLHPSSHAKSPSMTPRCGTRWVSYIDGQDFEQPRGCSFGHTTYLRVRKLL